MSNLYDQLEVDINALHQRFNSQPDIMSHINHKGNIVIRIINKVLCKLKIYQKLVESGFIRRWFIEFHNYWREVLGGRPLQFHDFFYLYSWYRGKFSQVEVKYQSNEIDFIKSWQKPENIFLLFKLAYIDALSPFAHYQFRQFIKNDDKILEYGCGSAPIITSLINDNKVKHSFTIADIPQYTYHYAKWRLRQYGVNFIDLQPFSLPIFDRKFNIIFLNQVLEHLPKPLETIKYLTENLEQGGYLIFDYILGEGKGLDTRESINDRPQVLDYIKKHYLIKKGVLEYNKSMGATVARKQFLKSHFDL